MSKYGLKVQIRLKYTQLTFKKYRFGLTKPDMALNCSNLALKDPGLVLNYPSMA